jgi:hypothetical protein
MPTGEPEVSEEFHNEAKLAAPRAAIQEGDSSGIAEGDTLDKFLPSCPV